MKSMILLSISFLLISCWRPRDNYMPYPQQKVWGNKPVYASKDSAKLVLYDPHPHPVVRPGNIYAYSSFIFQADAGTGIHIIDNSISSEAARIGFITLRGCDQISIRGAYLYTNSYDDLITIDISDPVKMKVVSRVAGAFPEFLYNYPLVEPDEPGYYECPRMDSIVVGWVKDSITANCYKN